MMAPFKSLATSVANLQCNYGVFLNTMKHLWDFVSIHSASPPPPIRRCLCEHALSYQGKLWALFIKVFGGAYVLPTADKILPSIFHCKLWNEGIWLGVVLKERVWLVPRGKADSSYQAQSLSIFFLNNGLNAHEYWSGLQNVCQAQV